MFENLKKTAEPVSRFNKLTMSTVSKVGEMQMEALRDFMSMAGQQAKAATQIRDYEDFQKYLSDQAEMFNNIVEKASENMNELSRMADEFREEASEVFHEEDEGQKTSQGKKTSQGQKASQGSSASASKSSSTSSKSQAGKTKTPEKSSQ
ncbi:phasin family protein [Halospina denitrificans]|uniref:Phasin family protein n=2 Tax=Halospina denitrificans TaxID=332522 RepID=A0A4R7JQD1_9GAMM|nr:phasin family protein [Halospina denitrificans]